VILLRMWANIAGLVTLAVLCGLGSIFYFGLEDVRRNWTFYAGAYAVLGAVGWWVLWREDRDGNSAPWPQLVLASVGLGAVFFVCDIVLGRLFHSERSLFDAAVHVGGIMGFGATLIACPGMTLMALSGWARSWVLRRMVGSTRRSAWPSDPRASAITPVGNPNRRASPDNPA
jgi:hypothetical protein